MLQDSCVGGRKVVVSAISGEGEFGFEGWCARSRSGGGGDVARVGDAAERSPWSDLELEKRPLAS